MNNNESYCGYPGFGLNCTEDFPVLHLPENEYVVERIFYEKRTFRVYNAAVLRLGGESCAPRLRNTTLPESLFSYVNETGLRLFYNCNNSIEGLSPYLHAGCSDGGRSNGTLAMYDTDANLGNAMGNCKENVVVPVERGGDEGSIEILDVDEVLRRGFELNWRASDCRDCRESGGHCALPVVGALLLLSILTCIILHHKKKFGRSHLLSRNLSSKSEIEAGSFYFGIPVFSYIELEEATNNFDPFKEIGEGGFGAVYYGKLRDGREVAIKRLYEHNFRRMEQFLNEIKILTALRHPNLVSLYGCTSKRSQELLLVYEYIPNGTIADHLHGERAKEAPLSWPIRMKTAIETAAALAYLHNSDIIHRDVKTNNILLDSNYCVKVADFGLSRLFPENVTHVSTAPQGTPGYVDPVYHQYYQLTDKSDVYSFGVVLIELISSMPAVDINRHRHEINLANLALNRIQRCAFDELIDASLGYGLDPEVTRMTTTVAELAFRCLQLEKDLRPSMDEVVAFLKDIQGAENCNSDRMKGGNGTSGMIPSSPEIDDVVLLKNNKFQCSPIAVTDAWVSSASTTASFTG
ncbi:hypothetical protein ACS0TY_033376 [Phlomoides rotata]